MGRLKKITDVVSKFIDEYLVLVQFFIFFVIAVIYNRTSYATTAILFLVATQLVCISVSLKRHKRLEVELLDLQKEVMQKRKNYTSEPINLNQFLNATSNDLYCYSVFGAWLTDHRQKIIQLCKRNIHIHLMIGGNIHNCKEYANLFSSDKIIFKKRKKLYEANLKKFSSDIAQIQHSLHNNNFEVRYINKVFPCSFFARDSELQDGVIFWRDYLLDTKKSKNNRYHGFFIRQSDIYYHSYVDFIHDLWESADKTMDD